MPEILKADFELRKILTTGQRTEDQEIKTDTLVIGNANIEIRVKGEPPLFTDFVPGSILTISFTQSQTTLKAFDAAQAEEKEEKDMTLVPGEDPALLTGDGDD